MYANIAAKHGSKSLNLLTPFSYKSQFTTPFTEIANTQIFFFTFCDYVLSSTK